MGRSSGILLPIFSLPSPQGIGTFGKGAYEFIDFLSKAGQKWWQILPLGTADAYGSPYQSDSAFAVNPLLLDLELLHREGYLRADELQNAAMPDAETVPYDTLFRERMPLLHTVGERCYAQKRDAVEAFCDAHPWCRAYARFSGEETVACALQYLAFTQWQALRRYANERGVSILGDVPLYVARESADVWEHPEGFQLDEKGEPTRVSGAPPDAFCADGQRWGHPLYDWEKMRADGYAWWISRMAWMNELYDGVRLDHFRAFDRYWAVAPDCPTARDGRWEEGGGLPFLQALQRQFPDLFFVAEDLGFLDERVHQLRKDAGFYGMTVLQFAFSPDSLYLPHNHTRDRVCYTGTHDNPPLYAWCRDECFAAEQEFAMRYLGADRTQLPEAILRAGMASVSDVFIAPMQDYLGATGRINAPGTLSGNWQWRMPPDALSDALAEKIRGMTWLYARG